jgi:DNA repair exonuclease SbcCD ATPase subunit
MALTANAVQLDGWDRQAERLVFTHAPFGTAAMAIAKQMRQPPPMSQPALEQISGSEPGPGLETGKTELSNELVLIRAELPELEQRAASAETTPRPPNGQIKRPIAQILSPESRITEPEDEFEPARDEPIHCENESHSLQTSLDLVVGENTRLCPRLAERDAAIDNVHSQLEQAKAALAAAEVERKRLSAALDEANEKLEIETNALNTHRDAMSSRVVAVEKLLAETRESLLAYIEEKTAIVSENLRLSHRLAESDAAVIEACSHLERVKMALTVTEAERDKLASTVDEASKRLQTETESFAARLKAMSSRAEAAEAMLAEMRRSLFEKLDRLQTLHEVRTRHVQELEDSRSKLIDDADTLLKTMNTRDTALVHTTETVKLLVDWVTKSKAKAGEQIQVRPAETLIANTITF